MAIYKSGQGERAIRERYLQFLERWPAPDRQFRGPTSQRDARVVSCGNWEGPPVILFDGGLANPAMGMGDIPAWAAEFRIFAVGAIGEPGLGAPARPPLNSGAHAIWLDDGMGALPLARLERMAPRCRIRHYRERGRFIPAHATAILELLRLSTAADVDGSWRKIESI